MYYMPDGFMQKLLDLQIELLKHGCECITAIELPKKTYDRFLADIQHSGHCNMSLHLQTGAVDVKSSEKPVDKAYTGRHLGDAKAFLKEATDRVNLALAEVTK